MDWFLLFYRALVEEYIDPACKAGSIMLMNFNLYSSLPNSTKATKIHQSDSVPRDL